MRRWILRVLLVCFLLLVLAVAAAWLLLRGSLATLDGELALPGLAAPALLARDAQGSVLIDAASPGDAQRVLGFVHAQERYFEMDLLRRTAAGELAALFGPLALDSDRAMRRHRLRARAQAALAAEPPGRRALLEAYAAGVNAGLQALSVRPWPYLLLRQEAVAWQAEDSLLVALAMFVDLHDEGNRRELGLSQLSRFVSDEVFGLVRGDGTVWDAPLFGESRGLPGLPRGLWQATSKELLRPEAPLPGAQSGTGHKYVHVALAEKHPCFSASRTTHPATEHGGLESCASLAGRSIGAAELVPGSNNFAVAGSLTSDGRALVANDMHLGLRVPALWLRARLRYADAAAPGGAVDVSGVSLPGVPGIVAGSNGHVAWGFTNSYGDWADWFEVRWVDAARTRYRTPNGEQEAVRVEERIEVAGGDAEVLVVVETRWGPVLEAAVGAGRIAADAAPAGDEEEPPVPVGAASAAMTGAQHTDLALAWTAHRSGAVDLGLLEMARAATVEDAVAVAQAAGMPVQNLVVGDAQGRIAWTLAGRIPQRVGDCDPQLPMDPLAGCGWDGWLAPGEAPALLDPPEARLWTANARVVDGAALALVGDGGYALGARQRQIRDRLFARERFDEQALLDIQLDDRALFLERWWVLLRGVLESAGAAADPLLAALSDASAVWNGRAAVDSASYRIARAFRLAVHEKLLERLFADASEALGEAFVAPVLPQLEGVAWALLSARPPAWPEQRPVDWDALLADAAREVARELRAGGPDLSLRTWGERNTADIAHPLSGALPGFLAQHLDMPAEPLPGDAHMPRVQGRAFGASERFVVAPGREEQGILHLPGGPTGHPLSPFHGAGHRDWVEGRPSPFLPGPAVHRLVLQPSGS
jgi:penicillin amidase